MKYGYKDFEKDILYGIKLAEKELQERKNGIEGESTIKQLEDCILPELRDLLNKMQNREELPPNTQQDRYLMSFGNALMAWTWDIHHPTKLFDQLRKIHSSYRKI